MSEGPDRTVPSPSSSASGSSAASPRSSVVVRGRHRPHLDLVSISGDATEEELRAIEAALQEMVEQERQATSSSVWLRAARSQGRRLGMLDYRDRFTRADAWRLSARFPFGGREYPGRHGRGDTK